MKEWILNIIQNTKRFFILYLNAHLSMKDKFISWRSLPLITHVDLQPFWIEKPFFVFYIWEGLLGWTSPNFGPTHLWAIALNDTTFKLGETLGNEPSFVHKILKKTLGYLEGTLNSPISLLIYIYIIMIYRCKIFDILKDYMQELSPFYAL